MTDASSSSLDLEQVVRRFVESEQTLRDLEGRIRSLSELEQQTAASTEALDESATALADYVAETEELTRQLADVTKRSQQLLTQASEVLDGSQLQRIEDLVGENLSQLDERLSAQDGTLSELQNSVRSVDERLAETEARLVSELDPSEKLQALSESMGEIESRTVSVVQEQIGTLADRITGGHRTLVWLLVGVLILQAAALIFMFVRGP